MKVRAIHRTAWRWIAASMLFAIALGLGAAAGAQGPPDRDAWVDRYERLKTKVEELRTRVDTLEASWVKAKHRNYPRGEELEKMRVELDAARKELAETEEEWSGFEDEARRAGAPPGWFRED